MIVSLLATVALSQSQAQAPAQANPTEAHATPSASILIGNMFKKYSEAKSLSGSIKMVQSVPGYSIEINTTVAFERPSKLLIRQDQTPNGKSWLVTSDGKVFTYDYPNSRRWGERTTLRGRLMEAVNPTNTMGLNYRQIFRAASLSLGDDSFPLDVAIGDPSGLAALRDQIASCSFEGKQKLGDENVNVISGSWRAYATAEPSATFHIFLSDDGDLRRYTRRDIVAINGPNGASMPAKEITSVWDCHLDVNAKTDASMFQVVK